MVCYSILSGFYEISIILGFTICSEHANSPKETRKVLNLVTVDCEVESYLVPFLMDFILKARGEACTM